MSRIGKKPVAIPTGVTVTVSDESTVTVKGPKGQLDFTFHPDMQVEVEGSESVVVKRPSNTKQHRSLHGLTRALIANMVKGVVDGYAISLDILGVGYDGKIQDNQLLLRVGFAQPAALDIPAGLTVACPNPTRVVITGLDKQQVGQFAAVVRHVRPPNPYTTKGIKYTTETIKKKVGKALGSERS